MINPYAAPASDLSEPVLAPGLLLVQWKRPSFRTFSSIAFSCAFSMGIVVGLACFVLSLFGFDPDMVVLVWRFHGITAGALALVFVPLGFLLIAYCPILLFPLFRLAVSLSRGPRLVFHAEAGRDLQLSRLHFFSYLKLCALLGLLCSLFGVTFLLISLVISDVDDYGVQGVPVFFEGTARLIWVVTVGPLLHSFYAAMLGAVAFVPFRFVTRATGSSIPAHEVVSHPSDDLARPADQPGC